MSLARMMQMAAAGSAGAGPEPSGWTDPDLGNASYDAVSFSVGTQDSVPLGLTFNNDGTKMYVSGAASDDVFQYSLSTAFDLSTASYDSVSFDMGGQDTGVDEIVFNNDGTRMYMLGFGSDAVYQYSLSTGFDISTASYDSVSFSVAAQDTTPRGLEFNASGSKMYVCGDGSNSVYQYSLSTGFDISTASYDSVSFSVVSQDTGPSSLRFNPDGTKMFILGTSTDSVHQYSLSTGFDLSTASYDSVSFSVAAQESLPNGLAFKSDGSKMYVLGYTNDTIFQYSTAAAAPAEWTDPDLANASYDSVSFSVAGQDTAPQGMFFGDGATKLYVVGDAGDDVNQYSLSTPWDITTASYVQSFSVSSQETTPEGIFFKPDGTKMYVCGNASDSVHEYDLSTAWDLSTASFNQSLSVSTQEGAPRAVSFKPDGTVMLIGGPVSDSILQYSLSTAWDISTASYVQNFSISAQETILQSMFVNEDGTSLMLVGQQGLDVNRYSLSTPWDVSTMSYVENFSVSAQDTAPEGLFFKSDGSKMYYCGSNTDTIYQYSTD